MIKQAIDIIMAAIAVAMGMPRNWPNHPDRDI